MAARAHWLAAALAKHAAGRSAEAERICSGALAANPHEPDALNLLGLIAAHRGRFDLAAHLIGRAVALAPTRGDFHAALGNVFLMQNRQDAMEASYRRALLLTRFSSVPAQFSEIVAYAGSPPPSDAYLKDIAAYRSQYLQDVYLDRWVFAGMSGGVFADIGAHDGITLSNSWFFETVRGWSGICVEPNPQVFERLRANRHCALFNCCIAPEEGSVPFRMISGPSEMLSGIDAHYRLEHRDRIARELQQLGGSAETIRVPARTLAGIADERGISEIHYLSVDTEGGELGILRALPFGRLRVHAITVECNFEDERAPIASFLSAQGFTLAITLGSDLLFVHKNAGPAGTGIEGSAGFT